MKLLLPLPLLACLCLSASAQEPPVPYDARPVRPVPPARALTIDQFVRTFEAAPGCTRYEAVIIHPCTCQPVSVCFELPGCPRRILYGKTEIVFRYGLCKKPVRVTFCRDGGVVVS